MIRLLGYKFVALFVSLMTTLVSTPIAFAGASDDTAVGLHLGLGTYGGGDTNGQMPHVFYYRGNFVSSSGIEGNLSIAMQTIGKRFQVTERLHFGLHGGFGVLADSLNTKLKPATYFSVSYQPFCFWVCLGVDSFTGVLFNSFRAKPNVVPVSSFSLGLYLWF